MAVKECLLCLLFVVVISHGEAYHSGGCAPNLVSIYWCIITKLRVLTAEENCALKAMMDAYTGLVNANCINCDKYFHCVGNYNAVYGCQKSPTNIKTAKIISNCREGDCDDDDTAADKAANRYGRHGGDCASRYLCDFNCNYNPVDRTCDKSNC
ncbi:hypothetical protein LSH36_815g03000 [Paralvinella palmiformis]|uniref:Uncharacterized protein n=1 Tax=Paralvinella palmiformis TaxID=53620 RepID=A0AAD9J0H0_9ANNE|nr:hypothetical protein LSH36_815g03000 [Paralvinella palmiformis]